MNRFAELKGAEPRDLPEWLKKATIQEAIVEVDDRGRVVWKDGVWLAGTWRGHVWQGGVWKDGCWEGGNWINGLWVDGEWQKGSWTDGVWLAGRWLDGTWKGGIWYDGMWTDGMWKNGKWVNGIWVDGIWCGGRELGTREICEREPTEEDSSVATEFGLKELLDVGAISPYMIDAESAMKEARSVKTTSKRAEKIAIAEGRTKEPDTALKPNNFETSDDLVAQLFRK